MAGHGEVNKIKQNTTVRGPLDPLFGIKNFVVTLLVTMYNLLLTINSYFKSNRGVFDFGVHATRRNPSMLACGKDTRIRKRAVLYTAIMTIIRNMIGRLRKVRETNWLNALTGNFPLL